MTTRMQDAIAETSANDLIFTGYHYRTSSRFGGPVTVRVADGWVTVTGYRARRFTRTVWVWLQGILIALILGSVAVSLTRPTRRDWKRAGRFALAEYIVAAFGALLLWWPGERENGGAVAWLPTGCGERSAERCGERASSLGFRLSAVSEVRQTSWYSRRGLWLVSLPWQLFQSAAGSRSHKEVVFEASDPERPRRTIVFALNMPSSDDALSLVRALSYNEPE